MKISKAQQSVIAITAGLLVIAWLNQSEIFLVISCCIAITFFFRQLHEPLHKTWMALTKILGAVSSHCILFVLFYFFLTPLSFLRKAVQKKDSMKNFPGSKNSSFDLRNHTYQKKDFINPW